MYQLYLEHQYRPALLHRKHWFLGYLGCLENQSYLEHLEHQYHLELLHQKHWFPEYLEYLENQ